MCPQAPTSYMWRRFKDNLGVHSVPSVGPNEGWQAGQQLPYPQPSFGPRELVSCPITSLGHFYVSLCVSAPHSL